MKKRNLIVFDIDGTLTDSVKIHQKAFTETLLEIGVQSLNTNYSSFKHHTDSFIAKALYENDQSEQFSVSIMAEFEKRLTEKIKAQKIKEIKGAKKTIKHLEKHTNYGVCYATGSLLKAAKFKLESIGVIYNERLLIASDTIYERERIVSKAIEMSKEIYAVNKFEKIISIGDGLWDLIAAKKLGLDFIGIGSSNKKILVEHGAQLVLKNLTELKIE